MEFFQTTWRNGSSFNKGLTAEEFFYEQIYDAFEKNVQNKSLPFLIPTDSHIPVELSTGKIINDENLVALEQAAASKGYKSNCWIFGSELEKLSKQGVKLSLKTRNEEPVLCLQKYNNPIHLHQTELYIAEGGAHAQYQFMYNLDSFDEHSQKALQKHIGKVLMVSEEYSANNLKNYVDNVKKARNPPPPPELSKMKERIKKSSKVNDIDCALLVNAHARHICREATGNALTNNAPPSVKLLCYETAEKIINSTQNKKQSRLKVGEAFTKAINTGTLYAKTFTSKEFNLENNKLREETIQKARNLSQGKKTCRAEISR